MKPIHSIHEGDIMDTNYWICDSCGERITKAENGWVEWIILKDESGKYRRRRDIRLVHQFPFSPKKGNIKCQFDQKAEFAKDHESWEITIEVVSGSLRTEDPTFFSC